MKLFDDYYNIEANMAPVPLWHDFHKFNIYSKHIILSIQISKQDILKFHSQRNIFAPDISRMLILQIVLKHFPKNWRILYFNSRFGSKIIFSQVRLNKL